MGGGCVANVSFAEGACFCRFLFVLEVCLDRSWEKTARESAADDFGKLCQISSTFHRNSIQNRPNWHQERSKRGPGSKSVSGTPFWAARRFRFSDFGRHLGVFGRHFGSQRIPKGVQKSDFSAKFNIKCRKMRSRKASRKNMIFGWIFDGNSRRLDLQYLAPA